MYIYKDFVTDEALASKKRSVLRKLWMNIGQIDIYLIFLNSGEDQFDIIHTGVLKQKHYPKKDLYLLGAAKGWESAALLSGQLFESFRQKYDSNYFTGEIWRDRQTLFRRF